jgi:hypothetical protein
LVSQFHDLSTFDKYFDNSGTAYLALNFSGVWNGMNIRAELNSSSDSIGNQGYRLSHIVSNREWQDMFFWNNNSFKDTKFQHR